MSEDIHISDVQEDCKELLDSLEKFENRVIKEKSEDLADDIKFIGEIKKHVIQTMDDLVRLEK